MRPLRTRLDAAAGLQFALAVRTDMFEKS